MMPMYATPPAAKADETVADRESEVDRLLARNPGCSRLDPAEHLDAPEDVVTYRKAVAECGDPAMMARAEAAIAGAEARRTTNAQVTAGTDQACDLK
jgi:hypothetical protein